MATSEVVELVWRKGSAPGPDPARVPVPGGVPGVAGMMMNLWARDEDERISRACSSPS